MTTVLFILFFIVLLILLSPKGEKAASAPQPKRAQTLRPLTWEEKEAQRQAERFFDYERVRQIRNRTYTGPMPEHIVGGFYTSLYEGQHDYDIVGINYRRGISKYVGELDGYIIEDSKNRHDKNAIKICASDGHHLGFIRAEETDEVRKIINSQFPYNFHGCIRDERPAGEHEYYWGWIVLQSPNVSPKIPDNAQTPDKQK